MKSEEETGHQSLSKENKDRVTVTCSSGGQPGELVALLNVYSVGQWKEIVILEDV